MAAWRIQHDVKPEGLRFYVHQSGFLRSARTIAFNEWGSAGSEDEIAGLSYLLAWADEEDVSVSDESILVPHARVAELSEPTAAALGLPSAAPFVVNLQHAGTLDQPEFRFRATWLNANGTRLMGAERIGSILSVGTRSYRVPTPLYRLLEATEKFNEASNEGETARLYHWSLVQELLPESSQRSIKTDGYLQSTRIAHAAAFSLDLRTGEDGFTFDPVLFGAPVADRATRDQYQECEADESSITEAEQLLPDVQNEIFVHRRFNQFEECQPRYALEDGWYVVFDEATRQGLSVVRKVQQADRETRREFVRNPRAFIRKLLSDSFDESSLERLFIETAEFSQRVKDVGLWESVVLPWVQRSSDAWLPEKFGLRIGGQHIPVEPEEITPLKKAIDDAIKQGEATVSWKGTEIPASEETVRAINSLIGLQKPERVEEPPPEEEPQPEEPPPGPIVLVIDQNLEEVEFTRSISQRADAVDGDLPTSLKSNLKDHQHDGLRWLKEAWASGSSGVLLADDMGLGKTLQALAFLAWLREQMDQRKVARSPILMVAPVALLNNWQEEHAKHFHLPGIGEALVAYGSQLKALRKGEGREIDLGAPLLDSHELQRADWVLTTYETLRDYQHSFAAVRFAAIVYDEVQKIKTPGTIMTRAAKAMNGDFVLALTGTPVENRLADLWCIMDTLQPGALGDLKSFSAKYERDPAEADLKELKDTLMQPQAERPPAMLRRMKGSSLQGLPPKEEHAHHEEMPPTQAALYNEAINKARNSSDKGAMLQALQSLKSVSLHPVHPEQADGEHYIEQSARLKATFKILDQIAAKDEKALIFLESREMQPVVAGLIQRRYKLDKQPMLINGAVSGSKRQQRVNEFQKARKGFDAIILSPRAGGVGLTLTAANHVIHLSRWWNPAVEDQCTDRAYRIGQHKDVHVYFPMAIHPGFPDSSFDARLHALLERKRALSREMLMPPVDPDADAANLFGQTVGGREGEEPLGQDSREVSPDEIDAMEPIQFENWVLDRLNEAGFEVSRTPTTHDHGADGVATCRATGMRYILQCKHVQRRVACDESAIQDLLRAREAYGGVNAKYLAITNAPGFSKKASTLAKREGIRVLSRADLKSWPLMLRA